MPEEDGKPCNTSQPTEATSTSRLRHSPFPRVKIQTTSRPASETSAGGRTCQQERPRINDRPGRVDQVAETGKGNRGGWPHLLGQAGFRQVDPSTTPGGVPRLRSRWRNPPTAAHFALASAGAAGAAPPFSFPSAPSAGLPTSAGFALSAGFSPSDAFCSTLGRTGFTAKA